MKSYRVVTGDLLDQPVEAIVNVWNRNLIPWWLLLPQGVSGAINKKAGTEPFRELRRHGVLPLGGENREIRVTIDDPIGTQKSSIGYRQSQPF